MYHFLEEIKRFKIQHEIGVHFNLLDVAMQIITLLKVRYIILSLVLNLQVGFFANFLICFYREGMQTVN